MTHKEWLDNEYSQWVKALQESTVHNFKEHPMVKRMLGEYDFRWPIEWDEVEFVVPPTKIMNIGGSLKGNFDKDVYYALKILSYKPKSIVEIGGGCGQLFAILRALKYDGYYCIWDLPEVEDFQKKYLQEVTRLTGLDTEQVIMEPDFCVSIHAYGEFDDERRNSYSDIINGCPHGLMVFNPHSGASNKFPWRRGMIEEDEYPLTAPGNKLITW